jgi:hypothetical protein
MRLNLVLFIEVSEKAIGEDFLTFEDGTERLSSNVGNQLQTYEG